MIASGCPSLSLVNSDHNVHLYLKKHIFNTFVYCSLRFLVRKKGQTVVNNDRKVMKKQEVCIVLFNVVASLLVYTVCYLVVC